MKPPSNAVVFKEALAKKLPQLRIGILEGTVLVAPSSESLKHTINERMEQIANSIRIEEIGSLENIKWGRAAYRTLGKDPTRYRLSSEKLLRRIVKREGIDFINNIVDVSNWLSVELQACIGTFDMKQLKSPVEVDYGRANEDYRCLANYSLNLEGLPIMRSAGVPVGSTTSDSMMTAISESSTHFLMAIYVFNPNEDLNEALKMAEAIMRLHCNSEILNHYTLGV